MKTSQKQASKFLTFVKTIVITHLAMVLCLSVVAVLSATVTGCMGTTRGDEIRSVLTLSTNAPDLTVAQTVIEKANQMQQAFPNPYTPMVSALLSTLAALLGSIVQARFGRSK